MRGCFVAGAVWMVVGCSAPSERDAAELTGRSGARIVGGAPASQYPEAALVDLYVKGQMIAGCSGSIIAPQVVLTAGHCVTNVTGYPAPDSWVVTAPYLKRTSKSNGSALYDWLATSGGVDPTKHDLALIFLATPIKMTVSQCPTLAAKEVANNTNVVNIGRIDNGQQSNTDLFVSGAVAVVDGTARGFPNGYTAQDQIEEGDSGGPAEVVGSSPHEIVAVTSGGGGGEEVLARVDLLYDWIQQHIQEHGGGCALASSDAGSNGDGGGSGGDEEAGGNLGSPSGGSPSSGGGCNVTRGEGSGRGMLAVLGVIGVAMATRRRRATRPSEPPVPLRGTSPVSASTAPSRP